MSQNNCPKWFGANLTLNISKEYAKFGLKITAPNGLGLTEILYLVAIRILYGLKITAPNGLGLTSSVTVNGDVVLTVEVSK